MTHYGDNWHHLAPPPRSSGPPRNPWPAPPPAESPGAGTGWAHRGHAHAAPPARPDTRADIPADTLADRAELRALRSAYRLLRRVATLTALGYFIAYVIMSAFADGVMGARVAGDLTLGLILGLVQLVVTFAAVRWYERGARRSVDRLALRVRRRGAPHRADAEAGR